MADDNAESMRSGPLNLNNFLDRASPYVGGGGTQQQRDDDDTMPRWGTVGRRDDNDTHHHGEVERGPRIMPHIYVGRGSRENSQSYDGGGGGGEGGGGEGNFPLALMIPPEVRPAGRGGWRNMDWALNNIDARAIFEDGTEHYDCGLCDVRFMSDTVGGGSEGARRPSIQRERVGNLIALMYDVILQCGQRATTAHIKRAYDRFDEELRRHSNGTRSLRPIGTLDIERHLEDHTPNARIMIRRLATKLHQHALLAIDQLSLHEKDGRLSHDPQETRTITAFVQLFITLIKLDPTKTNIDAPMRHTGGSQPVGGVGRTRQITDYYGGQR